MRVVGWSSLLEAIFCVVCLATIPAAVALGLLSVSIPKGAAAGIAVSTMTLGALALVRFGFSVVRLVRQSMFRSAAVEVSLGPIRMLCRILLLLMLAALAMRQPPWIVEPSFYLSCAGLFGWSLWTTFWAREWVLDVAERVGRRRGLFSKWRWQEDVSRSAFDDTVQDADDVLAVSIVSRVPQ